ncbi:MAG: 2-oxo acid dehydrogenase subunit E2 [Thermomicrobiales bacterium]
MALKAHPEVNAELDGDELILKSYYDIGIAVGAERASSCLSSGTPTGRALPRSSARFASLPEGSRQDAGYFRSHGRHLHDHQRRHLQVAAIDADPQHAARSASSGCTRSRRPVVVDSAVVVRPMMYTSALLRPPRRRQSRGCPVPGRIKELIEDPETMLLEG